MNPGLALVASMLSVFLAVALASVPIPGPSLAFHDALSAAKTAIYEGDYEAAELRLSSLVARLGAGENPGEQLAVEAQLFLGDVQFVLGQQRSAKQTFERLLLEDPTTVMSPYDHAEDVRALFALVREDVLRQHPPMPPVRPLAPPPPTKMPLSHYAPFGVGQWRQHRRPAARLHTSLQGALAVGSIASFILLERNNHPDDTGRSWTPEQIAGVRYGVQWPTTIGFYAVWGWSVLDASRNWRREQAVDLSISPNSVEISGRFR